MSRNQAVPSRRQDPRLERVDETWLRLPNRWDIPVEICASPDVPLEAAAVDEVLSVLQTQDTLERLAGTLAGTGGLACEPRISRVVLTPDFHKGSGIPIGTVLQTSGAMLPQAVGNDINCGMRVEATSLTVDQVRPHLDALEGRLRHLFFEGGRRIALTGVQREALLRDGLASLLVGTAPMSPRGDHGVWRAAGPDDLPDAGTRGHAAGYPTSSAEVFRDWIVSAGGTSFDSVIGSVGGGNHFAEVQYVAAIHDGPAAYAWGLTVGQVVLMVHSGSLGLGHQANACAQDSLVASWPRGLPAPPNKILPFLLDDRTETARQRYLNALGNAANFAVGNRFFLALMLRAALSAAAGELSAAAGELSAAAGELSSRLVYDAPHNLLWPDDAGQVLHRKGATPAAGYDGMQDGPYAHWGEPVIVPGSMGAPSYLLRGTGNPRALASACHGAGRRIPRGAASRATDADLQAFLREFRVVTPLNHRDPQVRRRSDVMTAWRRDLKQEAPWAYKNIGPVVSSLSAADIAHPVVQLQPILTVKG